MIYNRSMKRNVTVAFLVLIGILGFFFWRSASGRAAPAAIQTAQVMRRDFEKVVSSSGKTAADRSVELKFQTSGRLAWVNVKEGDRVSAYQAIAGMDAREVQKSLEKALVDYSIQRNAFEDTRKYDTQANTPKDALNERMRHLLEENQWDLTKAVLDVELKHLAVEFSMLVTPIAGIVTNIDAPVAGVNITPATATFTVVDPDSLVFEAKVDETDVGRLTVGQAASIALDAFPQATFSGKISYVSYTSETSAGGATVFPVKILFDEPQKLRIGLNGDVTIRVEHETNVLTVPSEAIREDESGSYVYLKTGKGYDKRPVKVGSQNDNEAVITEGLSVGDYVVTKGFGNLPKSK